MNGQTMIIILLAMIVLKLYPEIGLFLGPMYWTVLAAIAIGFFVVGGFWLLGLLGNWLERKDERKKKRTELRDIKQTLKQIDYFNKKIK